MTQNHVRIIITPESEDPYEINLDEVTHNEIRSIHQLIYTINGPTELEENNQQQEGPADIGLSHLQRWANDLSNYLVSDVLDELKAEMDKYYALVPVYHGDMVVGELYYIHPSYAGLWREALPNLEFKLLGIKPHHSEKNQFLMDMESTDTGEVHEGHAIYAYKKVLIPKEV